MTSYEWLLNIKALSLENKSILLIGAGAMAKQYAQALKIMNIQDVTVLSRNEERTQQFCKEFDFIPLPGGFEKHLPKIDKKDLTIVATPIPLLSSATMMAAESTQNNILVEKPVSTSYYEVLSLAGRLKNQRVRVAFNRLVYPNLHKLKQLIHDEGGITSCRYTFTEWPHKYNFEKNHPDIFKYIGITNCLHPITMVHELIGMPAEISAYQNGKLEWHPSGAIFVGSGITERNIPFSYHADWNSAGRWGIEIMTNENSYRLMPLEELYVCRIGTVIWNKVPFDAAYPSIKQGVAEELAIMLSSNRYDLDVLSLEKTAEYIKLANKIFGYSK